MDKPRLTRVRRARRGRDALVVIQGYLTQDDDQPEDLESWVEALRGVGWEGSIHHLWWDASSLGAALQKTIVRMAKLGGLAAAVPLSTPWLAVAGAGLGGSALLHWSKIKRRAKRTGRDHAAELLGTLDADSVSLIGHSLGGRVSYYTVLAAAKAGLPIRDVVLLGAALRRDSSKDWGAVADHLDGRLLNVHSTRDYVLGGFYRVASGSAQNPAGFKEIKAKRRNIQNISASPYLKAGFKAHSGYRKVLAETVGTHGWPH